MAVFQSLSSKRVAGKRQQPGLFFFEKQAQPAALFLLKESPIKLVKCSVYRMAKFAQREELFIAECSSDPGSLFHIQKDSYIRILAVCHYTDKYVHLDDLAGIGFDDHGRISCPVTFDLFAGVVVDMHRCTMFLLILLDMIAELRIHEWFIAVCTAFFHVFCS